MLTKSLGGLEEQAGSPGKTPRLHSKTDLSQSRKWGIKKLPLELLHSGISTQCPASQHYDPSH